MSFHDIFESKLAVLSSNQQSPGELPKHDPKKHINILHVVAQLQEVM